MLLRLLAYQLNLLKLQPTLTAQIALNNLYNDFKVTVLYYTRRSSHHWDGLISLDNLLPHQLLQTGLLFQTLQI